MGLSENEVYLQVMAGLNWKNDPLDSQFSDTRMLFQSTGNLGQNHQN